MRDPLLTPRIKDPRRAPVGSVSDTHGASEWVIVTIPPGAKSAFLHPAILEYSSLDVR
jgi:hypothetical protein